MIEFLENGLIQVTVKVNNVYLFLFFLNFYYK
jgi:hypothetical protein